MIDDDAEQVANDLFRNGRRPSTLIERCESGASAGIGQFHIGTYRIKFLHKR